MQIERNVLYMVCHSGDLAPYFTWLFGEKFVSLCVDKQLNIRQMKKYLFVLMLALCSASSFAQTQSNSDSTYVATEQWEYKSIFIRKHAYICQAR
jgi:hypothetical protein